MRKANYKLILGENVKALRLRANLSQEDLAARCGIFRTYLSRVENGVANASVLVVTALAQSLGVHPSVLFSAAPKVPLDTGTQAETDDQNQFPHIERHDLRFADFLQDIVSCFDRQLRHTYVNFAVELFTGRPASDFIGRTNRDLGMPMDLVDRWEKVLREVFLSGCPSDIQFAFDTPNGSRQFRSHISPHIDERGVVTAVISRAREVDFAYAPDLMAEHYRAIVDSSDDAIVGKTLSGNVISWNRGAEEMFGYSRLEMVGKPMLTLFPQDRYNEEQFILERLTHGEKVEHFETVRIRKDGQPVHVSVSISPIRNFRGDIVGASKVARNITPLKLEHERLTLALEATCNGLWDWDLRTGMVYASSQIYDVTGYTAEDDTHDFEFFKRTIHPQDLPRAMQQVSDCIDGKRERIDFEYRLIGKEGTTGKWLHAMGRPVEKDAAGKVSRLVGTLSDITSAKQSAMVLHDREQRLSRVLEGSDQGYWEWNLRSDDLQVSARYETMLGYDPGEMAVAPGRRADLIHPDDLSRALQAIQGHLTGHAAMYEAEIRCRTKSGGWRWILARGRVVERDSDGKPVLMSGTHTDINQRKDLEQAQRQSLTVFTNSYEGIMVVDASRLITEVNPAFTRITGYGPEEVVGKTPGILSSGRQNEQFYTRMWESIHSTGFWSGEIWNRRKNGELYAQMLSISRVADGYGEVLHYIGIFSDISTLKAHEAELDRVAHYDPLTGAANRRLLSDRLAQAISRTNRGEMSLAVCYLDLDGFKAVNDRYGHPAGDALLVAVAESLKQVLRAEDTLARLGGDEFVLLLADIGSPEECSLVLERILSAVNTPLDIEGNAVAVSASIGVSLYPQDKVDADTLLRHADQAMYAAKDAGKNRFHMFDLASDQKAQIHRQLVERLAVALVQDEFCLYYQPQVDLITGRIVGVEALIRWQHPQTGLRSPAEFLPHIQGTSLERQIGLWVIQTALRQMLGWAELGQACNVSVNISASHLLSGGFVEDLRQALATHPDVSPARLELEVLESTAIDDFGKAAEVLTLCRSMGVRVALDDFGTGYSSLTYLRKLPIDLLKIDRSFVQEMLTSREDLGIVEGVVRLASAFGLNVIAEGVESLELGALLLKLGCRLAQGYGIARPMPPEQLADWAKQWTERKEWLALHWQ